MQYRIYIDALFGMNFCMDFLLLWLVSKLMKCSATRLSLLVGALAGTIAEIVVLLFLSFPAIIKIVIAYGVVAPVMVAIGLRLREVGGILKGTLFLFGVSVFLFGFLGFFYKKVSFLRKNGVYALPVITLSYFFAKGILYWVKKRKEEEKQIFYEVSLKIGEENILLRAIKDTGNQLYEPITGRPVSIVEEKLLEKYIREERVKGFCIIPFHSIGTERGILRGYEVEEITWYQDGMQRRQEKIMVAVSKEAVSASGQYQMILHPKLFDD